MKELRSENEALKSKEAQNALGNVMDSVVEIKGVKFLGAHVSGVDMNELRNLGDDLKTKLGEGVILLISDKGGKVSMVAMATDGAVKSGAHAGNLIKQIAPIVGGGGGGRPNMAQAGGKDAAKIDEAIAAASAADEIKVGKYETIDSALRRFKRNCAKAGIQQEIRKREHYEKPSVRRKKKSEAARKRKFN